MWDVELFIAGEALDCSNGFSQCILFGFKTNNVLDTNLHAKCFPDPLECVVLLPRFFSFASLFVFMLVTLALLSVVVSISVSGSRAFGLTRMDWDIIQSSTHCELWLCVHAM